MGRARPPRPAHQRVVNEGEEQVLPYVAHDRLRQPSGAHDASQVAFEECHAGALHRDIGAGAHGDADIRGGERRCIVDAIARHRNYATYGLIALDDRALLFWQDFRLDFVDSESPRDGFGCGPVVPGEHDDPDTFRLEPRESLRRGVLDRVSDGEDARHAPVHAHEDRRGALLAQLVGLFGNAARVNRVFTQEGRIAEHDLAILDPALCALSSRAVEIRDRRGPDPALLRRLYDGDREWMLARPFDARSQAQDLLLGEALGRYYRRHGRLALGERAGLVDHKGVDLLHALERLGVVD